MGGGVRKDANIRPRESAPLLRSVTMYRVAVSQESVSIVESTSRPILPVREPARINAGSRPIEIEQKQKKSNILYSNLSLFYPLAKR